MNQQLYCANAETPSLSDAVPKRLAVTFALHGKEELLAAVSRLEEAVASLGVTVEAGAPTGAGPAEGRA